MLSPQRGISSQRPTARSVRYQTRNSTQSQSQSSAFPPTSPPRRAVRETKSLNPKLSTPPPRKSGQLTTKSPYASPGSPIASAARPISPTTSRQKLSGLQPKSARKLDLYEETSNRPLKSIVEPVYKEEPRELKKETLFSPAYKIESDENHRVLPHSVQQSKQFPQEEDNEPEQKRDFVVEEEGDAHMEGENVENKGNVVDKQTGGETEKESDQVEAGGRQAQGEVEDEFDPFLFIKNLPPLSPEMKARKVILPKRSRNTPPICLALDLDETLVHCSIQPLDKAELTFGVTFNSQEYKVYVRMRPYLAKFLRQVSMWFEIVVFTASQKVYADKLLNILDPKRRYIKHRIFRDSCVCVDGNYLKDLTVLGRDLSKVAIVDNSVQAFGFQLNNGIPIESWFDDDNDQELLNLIPFLQKLKDTKDVRPLIKKTFRLEEFVNSL